MDSYKLVIGQARHPFFRFRQAVVNDKSAGFVLPDGRSPCLAFGGKISDHRLVFYHQKTSVKLPEQFFLIGFVPEVFFEIGDFLAVFYCGCEHFWRILWCKFRHLTQQMSNKPTAHFKKTNYIIEAKYKLGVMETFLFTQAYMTLAEDDHSESHKIYFKDVIENFGLHPKGDTYEHILRAARSLRQREIIFKPVNEAGEEETEVFTGFFTKVKVHKRKLAELAHLEVFIDPDLRPHLIALKRYTLLNKDRYAWICSCLRSANLIRLYDLLKQYEKIGWRKFQLEELKAILQLEEQYRLYGSFKQKVISEAQRLFQQYADIAFSYKEEKKGKAVVALVFTIFQNIPAQAPEAMRLQLLAENERKSGSSPTPSQSPKLSKAFENPLFAEIFPQVNGWGINEATLLDLLSKHDEATVRRALKNTRDWVASGKMKANAAGFFVKSLREKWQTSLELKAEQLRERKRREAENRQEIEQKISTLQIQLDALADARRGEINQIVREIMAADAAAAMRAVQGIKENVAAVRTLRRVHGIENLENLQMNDYRQNPVLREQVIHEIMRQHELKFAGVRAKFDSNVGDLEGQIKKLRGSL